MQIVVVSHKPPFPEIDGGCIATANMIQNLQKCGFKVKLFCLSTPKHIFVEKNQPKWFKDCLPEYEFSDTTPNFSGAIKNYFKTSSYFVARFQNKNLKWKITSFLLHNEVDFVQVESLFSFPLIDFSKTKTPIVYRSHNIEHKLWEERIGNEKSSIKRFFLKHENKKLFAFEKGIINHIDAAIAITQNEKDWMKSLRKDLKVEVIKLGFPIPEIFQKTTSTKDLFYIGAFDWQPNAQGIDWFVEEVFPLIKEKQPNAQFHLAGKNLDKKRYKNISGIFNHGEVEDKISFFKAHNIFVLPLFSGSGLRVKLIEALSYGKPTVSTKKGAEGADAEKVIFISDNPHKFAENVVNLLENDKLFNDVTERARDFAAEHYSETEIQRQLKEFYLV